MRGGDRLLAQALDVERDFLLPLRDQHARVESARLHHCAQAAAQAISIDLRRPGADGTAVVVEHAHQRIGQVAGFDRLDIDGGPLHRAGRRQVQVREVGAMAWSPGRFRHVQTKGAAAHGHSLRPDGSQRQRSSSCPAAGESQVDPPTRRDVVHRRRAQRCAGRWAGYGQDTPCHGHRRVGHHPARQAGALLLHRGPGQRAGA